METGGMTPAERVCHCDLVPHKAFHHSPPSTMESRTLVPSVPVDPSERERNCECRRAYREVEASLCECGHADESHYSTGGCDAPERWAGWTTRGMEPLS